MSATDQPTPTHSSDSAQWIDDAAEVSRLLTQAAGRRLMLAVGGSGGPRNALLLAADPSTRQLVIDPPFPPLPELPQPGELLSLSTRIDGAMMDFTTPFEALAELAGEEALLLRWPQRLRYLQRRAAHRHGIPRELHVPPAVLRDHQGPFTATLVDLSRYGAGALVSRSVRPEAGQEINCTIRVGDVEFTASAAVRSCIASLNRLRLGLEFGEITGASADKLSAAVARLERLNLRKAAERRERGAL